MWLLVIISSLLPILVPRLISAIGFDYVFPSQSSYMDYRWRDVSSISLQNDLHPIEFLSLLFLGNCFLENWHQISSVSLHRSSAELILGGVKIIFLGLRNLILIYFSSLRLYVREVNIKVDCLLYICGPSMHSCCHLKTFE